MEARKRFIYFFLIVMGCCLPCDAKMVYEVEVSNPGLNKDDSLNRNYSFPARLVPIPESFPLSDRMEFQVTVVSPSRYFGNGCAAIDHPPKNDSLPAQLWIALIPGKEDCNFLDEVQNAQEAGYDAAIIYGNDEWEANAIRSYFCSYASLLESKSIHIPTYFISQNDGFNLTTEYRVAREQGHDLLLATTYKCVCDGSSYERSHFTIQLLAEIIVATIFAAIFWSFIFVIVKTYKYFINRRFWANIDSTNPTKEFKSGDPYESCAICYEKYIDGDIIRLLHRSHEYHSKCVDRWLLQQKSCPTCTRRVY